MDHKRKDVLKSVNDYFQEAERSVNELQNQLAKVTLERDIYKEMLEQVNIKSNTIAYVAIYSCDNGEGVDTDKCIGVFTMKSLALQAISDVCNKNKEVSIDAFQVGESDVGKTLVPNEIVYIEQCDEEAHCEISTNIISILCDPIKRTYNHSYLVEYNVDKVYYID